MTIQASLSSRLPVVAVAGSIILHLLFSVPLMLPGTTVPTEEVTFVDLSASDPTPSPQQQSPAGEAMKAPVKEPIMEEETTEEIPDKQEVAEQPEVTDQAPVVQQQPRDAFSLGLARGFFNTIANGRTLRPELRDYYLHLLEKVNEKWWAVEVDHRQLRREVMAIVIIARNGVMVAGRIVKSSGDPILDDLVMKTIVAAAPFEPLPEGFSTDFFQAPIRLVPPLSLGVF